MIEFGQLNFAVYALQLHGTNQYNVFMAVCFGYRLRSETIATIAQSHEDSQYACLFCHLRAIRMINPFNSLCAPAHTWTLIISVAQSVISLSVGRAIFRQAVIIIKIITYCFAQTFETNLIFRFLDDNSQQLSEKTRQTHTQLSVALAVRRGRNSRERRISELCVASSPLITLMFVAPYRRALLSIIPFGSYGKQK
ncbi:hypothetical protein PRIPAC_96804, partial [Pristionchus pacificus]|uniref:G protein-coupled receptor n=1 Tax=Pristionchus pacificus TaxID=54126 RepID=A0A2A6B3F1_PRIPA